MNIAEINNLISEQEAEEKQLKAQLEMIEKIAKQKMTREAIARYGTVKLAFPEKAVKVISLVAQAVQSGIKEEIDDNKFKEILQRI